MIRDFFRAAVIVLTLLVFMALAAERDASDYALPPPEVAA